MATAQRLPANPTPPLGAAWPGAPSTKDAAERPGAPDVAPPAPAWWRELRAQAESNEKRRPAHEH